MKSFKRTAALIITVFLLIPSFCLFPMAEGEDWIYIDGENINRQVNTAVIYRGVSSTGQSQWGHDIVIDAEGKVTEIIEGGSAEGGDLTIPEGGAVISATGTKVQWFKDNVDEGDFIYYDSYTQRLFVSDTEGGFDPYFSKVFDVSGSSGAYILSNPEVSGTTQYSFDIAVDENGKVIARGGDLEKPEGGFILSAAADGDRENLIMYAPIGADCSISEGKATLTYSEDMLSKTAETAIANANAELEKAKADYLHIDVSGIEETISDAATAMEENDYRAVFEAVCSLEQDIKTLCADNEIYELRSAFHIPDETNATEVKATVLSAKAAGLNSITLRVTNGYGTFIPMPEGSKFSQDAKFGGFDVFQAFIDICREENVALTLCIEVYYNEFASIASPEWLTETNGSDEGLSNKYFSPSSREFKEYFLGYIEYIIGKYDIDSLMFDYLRYPKFTESSDLGYDYDTLQMFANEYGLTMTDADGIKTELFQSPHWSDWVKYRTSLVDGMAKAISEKVRGIKSNISITAVAERDSVDHYYMQNAIGWIQDGLFDGLTVAVYEADTDEHDELPDNAYFDGIVADKGQTFADYTGENAYLFIGLESSGDLSADVLENAVADGRSIGADGFVFSSLEDYISQNYGSVLSKSILRGNAVSPFGDTAESMTEILEYSKNKINDYLLAAGGCDESVAGQAGAFINEALTQLEEGALSFEQAQKLESDIAMTFASSEAKDSALKEFAVITKLALLAKERSEITPPSEGDTSEDTSTNDISSDAVSSDVSENAENSVAENTGVTQNKLDIDVGSILIYGFVGLASAAVIAALAAGIKRRKKKPANQHMPKNYEKDKTEE